MSFMELQIYQRGATYTADCAKCGHTVYAHEWVTPDHNEMRDAMEAGKYRCDECSAGRVDPSTFRFAGRLYAGRYSAPGYMDCTDWSYGNNKRELMRELRAMYGSN